MLVIRGKVEEWRRARDNAYLLYAMHFDKGKASSKYEALPLPFDNEIMEDDQQSILQSADEAMEEYNNYRQYLENADPLKINK